MWFLGTVGVLIFFGIIGSGSPKSASTQLVTPAPSNPISSNPTQLKVELKVKESGLRRPIISATTNLPDGIQLMVSIFSNSGILVGQQNVVVNNGKFKAGPFTDGSHNYRTGTYRVEITSSIAALQTTAVQNVIGLNGQNMLGKVVAPTVIDTEDKVIDYSVPFTVH